jgi:hypothetical protein
MISSGIALLTALLLSLAGVNRYWLTSLTAGKVGQDQGIAVRDGRNVVLQSSGVIEPEFGLYPVFREAVAEQDAPVFTPARAIALIVVIPAVFQSSPNPKVGCYCCKYSIKS